MLLKSGADCNLPMEDGRTPLHIAAETGVVAIVVVVVVVVDHVLNEGNDMGI